MNRAVRTFFPATIDYTNTEKIVTTYFRILSNTTISKLSRSNMLRNQLDEKYKCMCAGYLWLDTVGNTITRSETFQGPLKKDEWVI